MFFAFSSQLFSSNVNVLLVMDGIDEGGSVSALDRSKGHGW